jgi:hypothetical protein
LACLSHFFADMSLNYIWSGFFLMGFIAAAGAVPLPATPKSSSASSTAPSIPPAPA